jgi:15-cis-phytoene synthase
MDLYLKNALQLSRITTRNYSTSFSLGIKMLHRSSRPAIYAIYGFVRFADEIVDTFHEQDRKTLLEDFSRETYAAIERRFSPNPVLHSFQWAVNTYRIPKEFIESFLYSMSLDLFRHDYDQQSYEKYIYGSAEVVGLMCLCVFCKGDETRFRSLLPPAQDLGKAFQKVNFLRDIRSDLDIRQRRYFPGFTTARLSVELKKSIEEDIAADFAKALPGIRALDRSVRLGVYVAYRYYLTLFRRICKTEPSLLLKKRIRISNTSKLWLLGKSYLQHLFNKI